MSEDALIAKYFAPLAAEGAFSLLDDGGCLPPLPESQEWALTTDSIASGVHLPGNIALDIAAKHLLSVNLSDVAAMAAEPCYVLLNAAFAASHSEADAARFAEGFAQTMRAYGLKLLGGDSIRLHASIRHSWLFSATIIAKRDRHQRVLRSQAQSGDVLAVTGTLGDAALGLQLSLNPDMSKELPPEAADALIERYLLPIPRLQEAQAVAGLIHALTDVSDGVFIDAARIARASGLGLHIDADCLPMSEAVKTMPAKQDSWHEIRQRGGGDYELLMSLSEQNFAAVQAAVSPCALTVIGRFDDSGEISDEIQGYDHFAQSSG